MLISRLRLHNFRCFFRTHEVDLSTSLTANLVVIYGENMRGKTTLMQAIRWGLYGEVSDRDGNMIPVLDPNEKEQLLSLDAASEGDFSVRVELEFKHEGHNYYLQRAADATREPIADGDFQRVVSLRRDTHHLAEASIDAHIRAILSPDVSRFFLFDGEMLQEYERLLKNPDREALVVKDAIEKILGLPALYVHKDLAEEATRDEKRLNALLRKRAKHTALVEEVSALENKLRSLRRDLEAVTKDVETSRLAEAEAELAVKRMGDVEKSIREKSILEQQIDGEKERLKENEEAVRDRLAKTWWLPVAGVIDQRLEELSRELAEATKGQEELGRIHDLEESLHDRRCVLCGEALNDRQHLDLGKHLTQLKLRLQADGTEVSLANLVTRQRTYERFRAPEAVREIILRQENIDTARVAIGDYESRINAIQASISDRAFGDMAEKTARWRRLSEQVRRADQQARQIRDQLKVAEAEHQGKQRQLNSLPEADPSLRLQASAYRELSDLFHNAMDVFRNRLRTKVGADASQIFRELTTEEAYSGLEIDEHYGLALLDSRGNAVPGRSAGAEQIVALSLVGGLNRAAVREGPVMMDTNFGRLDQGHRENVLRFLPKLGSQVMILVHSGELSKAEELSDLGVRVARRYEIERITETRSQIVGLI